MKKSTIIAAILFYYVIAVACRYAATQTTLFAGIHNVYLITLSRAIGPVLGALLACKISGLKLQLSLKGRFTHLLTPLCIYWIVPALLIAGFSYLRTGSFPLAGVFTLFVYALMEEIGWRSFLRPALQFLPKWQNILIVTVLWYCWHLNFHTETGNLIFFAVLLAGSWGIGVVADKTGSLLAVAAFHGFYDIISTSEHKTTAGALILSLIFIGWVLSICFFDKLIRKEATPIPVAQP